jgi:hypothetical protein
MNIAEAIDVIIRRITSDLRYLKLYAATVQNDNRDGTFDITPDDEEVRGFGLTRVPALVIAGFAVGVQQGTRCVIGFDGGDPRRPRIRAWVYQPNRAQLVIADGAAALACRGDYVEAMIGNPAPVSGTMSGTQFVPAPPGAPVPVPVPAAPFVGVVTGILPGNVHGAIREGARRLLG